MKGSLLRYGETTFAATESRDFPATARAVREARDWAKSLLSPSTPPAVLDDALLLLSEVVTNAIVHSDSGGSVDGSVTVHICRMGAGVQARVIDAGSATSSPVVRTPAVDDDKGRGLWLVDRIAEEWGHHRDETGGSVWFRVAGGAIGHE